ncbi:hypothetical protein [Microbacterium cremeum]|uniref:hypothetical protein n=1 Tax=Microbacterium cremeum TaxID=2782169 RepID=UPI001E5B5477|nr:hypothetical protein [Microbacterium cremeum]
MSDLPGTAPARGSLPRRLREALGVVGAIAIGIAIVAAVAASARSELLFRDGDSLVTTLVVRSIAAGRPQDWALSTVLFLPETAVLGMLWLLGLGVNGTLALAGVVNIVGLYGALRVAAGRVGRGRMPVTGALLALGAFGLLAAAETSPSRDALELASLLTTTTYYSATVIAVVLTVGLARRALDRVPSRSSRAAPLSSPAAPLSSAVTFRANTRPEPAEPDRGAPDGGTPDRTAALSSAVTFRANTDPEPAEPDRGAPDRAAPLSSAVTFRANTDPEPAEPDRGTPDRGAPDGGAPAGAVPWGTVSGIGLVAAASVVTNPMFAVWATVPLCLVLAVVAVRRRDIVALWLVVALVAGSALGFAGRMPLARLIANTGAGYADPTRWLESLAHYGALLAERWSAPWGAASVVFVVVLWGWSIVATVLLARRREVGAAVVAACGWAMPLLVVVGAIALGTHAARYLQPVAFGPVLGLVVLPALLPARVVLRSGAVLATGAAAAALVIAAAVGIPRIAIAASAPDPDLACVVDWVDDAGPIGGGQFWTVRLPKAHLADPAALVQVDHQLNGYAWLVNRDDFGAGEVSFLVVDALSPAFDLPAMAHSEDAEIIACGRYTIQDFGERPLPLGPQRS